MSSFGVIFKPEIFDPFFSHFIYLIFSEEEKKCYKAVKRSVFKPVYNSQKWLSHVFYFAASLMLC